MRGRRFQEIRLQVFVQERYGRKEMQQKELVLKLGFRESIYSKVNYLNKCVNSNITSKETRLYNSYIFSCNYKNEKIYIRNHNKIYFHFYYIK